MSDKLAELSQRVDAARDAARPSQLVRRPWVRFALAGLAGYLVGSRLPRLGGPAILKPLIKEIAFAYGMAQMRRLIQQTLPPIDLPETPP